MKRIFPMMLALALCFVWVVPIQASVKTGKTELKAEICSTPVAAIDQAKFDVLTDRELHVNDVSAIPFTYDENCSPIKSIMQVDRVRVTRAERGFRSAVRNSVNPGTITQAEYALRFRLHSLRC